MVNKLIFIGNQKKYKRCISKCKPQAEGIDVSLLEHVSDNTVFIIKYPTELQNSCINRQTTGFGLSDGSRQTPAATELGSLGGEASNRRYKYARNQQKGPTRVLGEMPR